MRNRQLRPRLYKVTFRLFRYDDSDNLVSSDVSFSVPAINSTQAEDKAKPSAQAAYRELSNPAGIECISIEEI